MALTHRSGCPSPAHTAVPADATTTPTSAAATHPATGTSADTTGNADGTSFSRAGLRGVVAFGGPLRADQRAEPTGRELHFLALADLEIDLGLAIRITQEDGNIEEFNGLPPEGA